MSEVRHRFVALPSPSLSRPRHPHLVATEGLQPSQPLRTPRAASAEHVWAGKYRLRLLASDTGIIVGSVAIAFLARFGVTDTEAGVGIGGWYSTTYWLISLTIVAAWSVSLWVYRTRDSRFAGAGVAEYRRVANASALAFGFLAVVFLLLKVDIARGYFILALPIGIVGLTLSRLLWRRWLTRQCADGRYLSRALIVGSRADVTYVAEQIHENSGAIFNLVGVALGDSDTSGVAVAARDVPVVSGLSGVADAAARLGVDTVIVAGRPTDDPDFIRNLSHHLEGTATELVLASRLTDVAGPRIHFRPMEGLPLIHVEIPQFEGGKHVLKRALDIGLSSIALVALVLPMLVIGILVKLDSRGRAVFRQERVGRGGRTFSMLKFRTMVQTAEADLPALLALNEGSGPLFKLKSDPRVTRIGRVLRRYSLDEFPQVWNVLIGDMSLVGPRPPLQREVLGYENDTHRRLYIKPGLTGMWQVSGRSDLSWTESVRLDLYYVENWSLTGDLIIIWRTFKVLLHPEGAY